MKKKLNIVIDASRIRSGGGVVYIKNFIKNFDNQNNNIKKIVIFSYNSLLKKISNKSFLIKKNHIFLEKNIFFQIIWQKFILPLFLKKKKIDLLYTLDSSSFCKFTPSIVFNQDILSFDKSVLKNTLFGFEKIRLFLIKYIQINAMRNASEIICLSNFSKRLISKYLINKKINVIYHGIKQRKLIKKDFKFKKFVKIKKIKLIYISPLFNYKNQLTVAKAYNLLKKKYNNLDIQFVGAYDHNFGIYKEIIDKYSFISKKNFTGQLTHSKTIQLLKKSDIFIFASSCEAFGITLLEAMSNGIPIVCSRKSSLPEILQNGGLYFDPKNSNDLSKQIELYINNFKLRERKANIAYSLSLKFTWESNLKKFNKIMSRIIN